MFASVLDAEGSDEDYRSDLKDVGSGVPAALLISGVFRLLIAVSVIM